MNINATFLLLVESLLSINWLSKLKTKLKKNIMVSDLNINQLSKSSKTLSFKEKLNLLDLYCPQSEPSNFSSISNPTLIDLIIVKKSVSLIRFSQISPGSFSTHDILFGTFPYSISNAENFPEAFFYDFKSVKTEIIQQAAAQLNFDGIYDIADVDDQKLLFPHFPYRKKY
ncbi:CLUMA_CG004249, isoform A [Clunio marinus]|uniref:CLUMA_CG004249, isoform A n=1 Tax=Clunio marinus TaxID=568069 RepID=A0A1J1HWN9_9DIPT|nr:CLUMA_CG004249, isoform A [Clunio marinus]